MIIVINCNELIVTIILFQLPTFWNAIFNLFKMVLPKKMTERLVLVGSDQTTWVSVVQFLLGFRIIPAVPAHYSSFQTSRTFSRLLFTSSPRWRCSWNKRSWFLWILYRKCPSCREEVSIPEVLVEKGTDPLNILTLLILPSINQIINFFISFMFS